MSDTLKLNEFLTTTANLIRKNLRQAIASRRYPSQKLKQAMVYTLLAEGKMLRPALSLLAFGLRSWQTLTGKRFELAKSNAVLCACAVECIHAYSLIHDDLPAMDDDDLRRGKESNHVKFGQAHAILAGDALQSFAFELLSECDFSESWELVGEAVKVLSKAASASALIGGQALDMEMEGEGASLDKNVLRDIHLGKTVALLQASLELGAICAYADEQFRTQMRDLGEHVGMLFQITDDILDATQSSEVLGKSAGKDLGSEKLTYATLLGIDGARKAAASEAVAAKELLTSFAKENPSTELLSEFIENILHRRK